MLPALSLEVDLEADLDTTGRVPMNTHDPSLETNPRLGKFILLRKLGTGGMAEVHLAEMTGPEGFGKLVAVKCILPHLLDEEDFIHAFISEARVGGSLNHPNIVQTLELGRDGRNYFLAMEYVQGVTLARLLRQLRLKGERLPLTLALDIGRNLCDGLAYAHSATDPRGRPLHMIHRDLKPDNVLLSEFGGVKITDFGVARANSNIRHTTTMGMVKGTVAYMSPEQAACRDLDHRSDLYSLGAILFEMLTLEPLHPGASGLPGLFRVQRGDIQDRLPLLEPFPQALTRVLLRLLAVDPAERYGSAREVKSELNGIAALLPPVPQELGELVREAAELETPPGGRRPLTLLLEPTHAHPDESVSSLVTNLSPGTPPPTLAPPSQRLEPTFTPEAPGVTLGRNPDALPFADVPLPDAASFAHLEPTLLISEAGKTSRIDGDREETAPLMPPAGPIGSGAPASMERGQASTVVAPARGASAGMAAPVEVAVSRRSRQSWWVFAGVVASLAVTLALLQPGRQKRSDTDVSLLPSSGAEAGTVGPSAPGHEVPAVHPPTPSAHEPALEDNPPASAVNPPTPAVNPPAPTVHPPVPTVDPPTPPAHSPSLPSPPQLLQVSPATTITSTPGSKSRLSNHSGSARSEAAPSRVPSTGGTADPGAGRPPAASPGAAAAEMGSLTVNAEPWAWVYIDGRRVNTTPLLRLPMPPGHHTIRFQTEDGRTVERPNVLIEPGKNTQLPPITFE